MLLRIIALLEGFSTLAIQMIALRQAIPIVGSSVMLTSIYIGVILLALSAGYWIGGVIAERYKHSKRHLCMILMAYLLIAAVWYSVITFGMHTTLLEYFLMHTASYIVTLFIVSLVLFVLPVLLASQTIPLLTELLPVESKGHAAGQMLFASTIGSFLGSVLTSIVLFPMWGVAMTGAVTVSVVLLAGVLSMRLRTSKGFLWSMIGWLVMSAGLIFSVQASTDLGVVYEGDTAYHDIQIRDHMYQGRQNRLMITNGGFSSARDLEKKQSPFPYLRELVRQTRILQPAKILLIGTAGFTYPAELQDELWLERLDAIDIDNAFLELSETYLLEDTLNDTIVFHPDSARYFLQQAITRGEQYDLIVVDAYNGRFVPAELATVEFFEDLQKVCDDDCGVMTNMILDYELTSDFAQSLLGAMQLVRPDLWIRKLHTTQSGIGNTIIGTTDGDGYDALDSIKKNTLPIDDKHAIEQELVDMRWK